MLLVVQEEVRKDDNYMDNPLEPKVEESVVEHPKQAICTKCGNKMPKTFIPEDGVDTICAKCLAKISEPVVQNDVVSEPEPENSDHVVTVSVKVLNIRSGVGKKKPVIGVLKEGEKVVIVEDIKEKSTSEPWGRIKGDEEKWIMLRYTSVG